MSMRPRPALATNLFFLLLFLAGSVVPWLAEAGDDKEGGFVAVDGTQFAVSGGGIVYLSGFNAYWLMLVASEPARRGKVVAAFREASRHGLNLARTWAFSDGGDTPLQVAPGVYDEAMFQALDFVVAEAGRHGIYLLLCLTNNFPDFGGKRQYVRWARDAGHRGLATADHFYNTTVVKGYYKDYVRAVLTRVNSVTGVAYRDDPTIFGWELMNEPRCDADPTGAMVQAWVEEMAPYVKSIDGNHLVTAGLEGFYGDGAHESKALNPWGIYYGTNFVDTHRARGVDFATIHLYPDVWLWGAAAADQAAFFRNWTRSHVQATERYLRKPLLVTEYGRLLWEGALANRTQRDHFLATVLDAIYDSAAAGGPLVGGAFWQLLDDGMDTFRDGYEIVLPEDGRAAAIISNHSRLLAELSGRRRNQSMHTHRKIHVGSSTSHTDIQQLLVRFVSLFRQQIPSLFSSTTSLL